MVFSRIILLAGQRMRKWIIRGVLAVVCCVVVGAGWVFWVWLWPSIRYQRVHHSIYETTSEARLQLLARQVLPIADTLGPTNGLFFLRGSSDAPIPPEFKDLDPTTISIDSDQVMLELCGGFDHYGFVIHRSEDDSNVWVIARYDESHKVQVAEYRHSRAAINPVLPKGSPFIREP